MWNPELRDCLTDQLGAQQNIHLAMCMKMHRAAWYTIRKEVRELYGKDTPEGKTAGQNYEMGNDIMEWLVEQTYPGIKEGTNREWNRIWNQKRNRKHKRLQKEDKEEEVTEEEAREVKDQIERKLGRTTRREWYLWM